MKLKEKIAAASAGKQRKQMETFLGEQVEVRGLTVGQRSEVIERGYTKKGKDLEPVYSELYPVLLASTLYDPASGEPVFDAREDKALINGLDPAEVDRVATIGLDLSGMGEESAKLLAGKSEKATAA